MTDMSTRTAVAVGYVLVLTSLLGCGATPPPPAPVPATIAPGPPPLPAALPPRPAELRVDGIDPCALLPEAQSTDLGLGPPLGQAATTERPADCVYLPTFGYQTRFHIRLFPDHGVTLTEGGQPRRFTQLVTVGGHSGTLTNPPFITLAQCLIQLDVAENQRVELDITAGQFDTEVRQGGCLKLLAAAKVVMRNLEALQR